MKDGGFSLLELMVVLGLMALLGVGLGVALSVGGRTSLRASEAQVGRFVQAVRMQAVLRQASARLIILDDPGDATRHLRWYGLIWADPESPGQWLAGDDGFLLPEGIVFLPDPQAERMSLDFPRLRMREDGLGRRWAFIEFDRRGRLKKGIGLTLQREAIAGEPSGSDGGLWIYPSGLTVFREGTGP